MSAEASYNVSAVRCRRRRPRELPKVSSPRDVYALVAPLVKNANREHFYGVYLNARNQVLAVELISVGSLNTSIVHPREVFGPAMEKRAASLIVAHNHPSGETDPSDEDLQLTRRLFQAGEILGVALLDHLIVSNGSWTSLKEEGHL